jgi:hypothetical protein
MDRHELVARLDQRVDKQAGGPLAEVAIAVASSTTSHVQEAHIAVGQLIAFLVEEDLYPGRADGP